MPRMSVIIVNYNGGAYVQGALDSLKAQTFRDFDVTLVDNASSDGSVDGLDIQGLPAFRLLRQSVNLGFAEGNNVGAVGTRSDWIVLLNPDAEAAPDWLAQIEAATRHHPDVAMFACAQIDLHDPKRLDGVGDGYLIFGFPWRGGFGHPVAALPREGEVFGPCGASAVYRRDVWDRQGGFDERFFCFCEDVDLAFRLRLAGERCVFLPGAVVRHAGGGLSGRASDFSIYHGARNRVWTYAKNMPWPLLVLTLPGHVVLNLYVLGHAALLGRFRPMLRGLLHGLAGLGGMGRRDPWPAPERRVSLWKLTRAMAWNPWRMHARKPHVRRV